MPSSVRTATNCQGRHPASTTNVSIPVIFIGSHAVDVLLTRFPLYVGRIALPLVRVVLGAVVALGEPVVSHVEHPPRLVGEVWPRPMGDERIEEDRVARRGGVGRELDALE